MSVAPLFAESIAPVQYYANCCLQGSREMLHTSQYPSILSYQREYALLFSYGFKRLHIPQLFKLTNNSWLAKAVKDLLSSFVNTHLFFKIVLVLGTIFFERIYRCKIFEPNIASNLAFVIKVSTAAVNSIYNFCSVPRLP